MMLFFQRFFNNHLLRVWNEKAEEATCCSEKDFSSGETLEEDLAFTRL